MPKFSLVFAVALVSVFALVGPVVLLLAWWLSSDANQQTMQEQHLNPLTTLLGLLVTVAVIAVLGFLTSHFLNKGLDAVGRMVRRSRNGTLTE
jgi:hypothetical protein